MSIPGYEILGEGCRCGVAVCYRARELATARRVWLEMFGTWQGAVHEPGGDVDSLRRRLELVALLEHPHILPILGMDRFEVTFYLVRPWIDGDCLDQQLREGPTEGQQAVRWARQAADAVCHAHEHGIFHPGLSPHDLFVTRGGDLLLTRFEGARVRFLHPPAPLEGPGELMGIPAYLAPEQLHRDAPASDPRRDVWALGMLLYRLAVGRTPFGGLDPIGILLAVLEQPIVRPRSLRPDLASDLEAIILRCLRKKPEDRYPDVKHLIADLDSYLAGRPVEAGRPTLVGRMSRWARDWWGPRRASG